MTGHGSCTVLGLATVVGFSSLSRNLMSCLLINCRHILAWCPHKNWLQCYLVILSPWFHRAYLWLSCLYNPGLDRRHPYSGPYQIHYTTTGLSFDRSNFTKATPTASWNIWTWNTSWWRGPPSNCHLTKFQQRLGDSRYYYYAADGVQLAPDLKFSSADNTTATLRLTVIPMLSIQYSDKEIIEHTGENTAIAGLGLVGGIWASVNGLFIFFFGVSLFCVVFGKLILYIYTIWSF